MANCKGQSLVERVGKRYFGDASAFVGSRRVIIDFKGISRNIKRFKTCQMFEFKYLISSAKI